MNKVFALTKVILKSGFPIRLSSREKPRKRRINLGLKIATFVIGIILFFFIFHSLIFDVMRGYDDLPIENHDEIVIIPIIMIFGVSFFFNFFTSFSYYFLSQDNDVYLSYPVTGLQIFLARYIVSNIYALGINGVMLIAYFIALDFFFRINFIIILACITFYFFITFVTTSVPFLLGTLLNKIFLIGKHKTLLTITLFILVSAGLIVLAIYPQVNRVLAERIISPAVMMKEFKFIWFLPYEALFSDQWYLYSLYMFLIAVGVSGLSILLAKFFYAKDLIRLNTGGRKRKRGKKSDTNKIAKSLQKTRKKPVKALLKDDFATIFRSPLFFFNYVFPLIVLTLFFTILGMIFGVEMYWFSFKEMVFDWYGNDPSFILAAILSSLFLLTLFIPLPVNCALSQEGETFHLKKTLPIKPWHYVMVKLIPTFTMQLIVGLCALIIGILFHPWFPIAVFLTYMLLSLALDFIALLFDSCFAVFDWQSESEYVRRPNSIFSIMGVGGGFIFILIQLFIVSLKVGENFPNVLHGTMALMAGLWVGFGLIALLVSFILFRLFFFRNLKKL